MCVSSLTLVRVLGGTLRHYHTVLAQLNVSWLHIHIYLTDGRVICLIITVNMRIT